MAAQREYPVAERVIGHRGVAGHAPENTLAGLRRAEAMGLAWVEFDVALTADGTPVLFHDETLDRTTNGSGRLIDHRWEDVHRLDAGSWFDERFAGEPVPSLHQAIAVLAALGLRAVVEIKAPNDHRASAGVIVARTLRENWPADLLPPILSSFSEVALTAAADHAPDYPRALLVGEVPADWRDRVSRLGCTALHVAADGLIREQAEAVVEAGLELRVFTVNERADAERFFRWGAAAVFSDVPERIVSSPARPSSP